MFFSIRWDLDYVPWDSPDALEFGHGEPAMLLKILELARQRGDRFQFVASNRVLRAFPAIGDAILDEGHDLDWLCKHPEDLDSRWKVARDLFLGLGKMPEGMAFKSRPEVVPAIDNTFRWTSGGAAVNCVELPLEVPTARDCVRSGKSFKAWAQTVLDGLQQDPEHKDVLSIALHPQMLARHDSQLATIRNLLDTADQHFWRCGTLRQAYAELQQKGRA